MTYKEIMELLKEIQDDCRERVMCNGCKFHTIEGCALHHYPDQWKIELIYTFPIEEFYKELEEGSGDNGKQ